MGPRPPRPSMPKVRGTRRPGSPTLAAIGLLALLLALPSPLFPAGPTASYHTAATPFAAPAHRAPVAGPDAPAAPRVRPSAITSLDWDGMGTFRLAGVNSNLVLGEGAAMVADSPYRNVIVFGGRGSAGLTNVTLEVSQLTGRWKNVTAAVGPSPRANMSFADDPARRFAVLFGGTTDPVSGRSDNSTWVFWYGNRSWENVTQRTSPPARESAAFAIDPGAGVAFLEGGRDPAFVQAGSTGSVTWNDTWVLNLSTFAWSPIGLRGTPTPMFGSSMAYDPLDGEFLLFGGCDSACSNAVLAVNLTQGIWRALVPPLGTQVPAPGGGADFVWSPFVNATVMFGGFGPTTSAFAPYNSTFVFDPSTRTWSYVQGFADPFARYAAAGAWLSANGCPGLFLAGGSSAFYGPPPDLWFLDPNPDTGIGCDIWGNDRVGNSTGNVSGCNGNGTLVVIVSDNATHRPIPGAGVSLTGACGAKSGQTNATGVDLLTHVPLTVETVTVTAADYHQGGTVVNVTDNYTANRTGPIPPPLWINLTHLPTLRLRTFGQNLTDLRYPLGAVDISLDDSVDLGNTTALGFLNLSGVSTAGGRLTFRAYKAEYSQPEFVTTLPNTGMIWVNLTLQAAGTFVVEVRLAGSARAVATATGAINPIDTGAPGGTIYFRVNDAGDYTTALPIGNFSVSAGAPGFASNLTIQPVFHPWIATTIVLLNLTPDQGFNLSVVVRDSATRQPIDNATVEVGYTYLRHTMAPGWANFSNVRPPGSWGVVASASGYASNQSFVVLGPLTPRASIAIYLTPLPCVPPGCVAPRGATPPGTFSLLPGSSGSLTFLLAAPLMFLAASIAYALYLRRRTASGRPA
jgi:hypothetical protein